MNFKRSKKLLKKLFKYGNIMLSNIFFQALNRIFNEINDVKNLSWKINLGACFYARKLLKYSSNFHWNSMMVDELSVSCFMHFILIYLDWLYMACIIETEYLNVLFTIPRNLMLERLFLIYEGEKHEWPLKN